MLADSKDKIKQVLEQEKIFYDNKLVKTYEAQRKDRMGDAIGDYLTDEKIDARVCYEEMMEEVQSWIDYHRKFLKKAETLQQLMLGNREIEPLDDLIGLD